MLKWLKCDIWIYWAWVWFDGFGEFCGLNDFGGFYVCYGFDDFGSFSNLRLWCFLLTCIFDNFDSFDVVMDLMILELFTCRRCWHQHAWYCRAQIYCVILQGQNILHDIAGSKYIENILHYIAGPKYIAWYCRVQIYCKYNAWYCRAQIYCMILQGPNILQIFCMIFQGPNILHDIAESKYIAWYCRAQIYCMILQGSNEAADTDAEI